MWACERIDGEPFCVCLCEEEEEQTISRVPCKVLATHQDLPLEGTEGGCRHIPIFPSPPYFSFPSVGKPPRTSGWQGLGSGTGTGGSAVALSYCGLQLLFLPIAAHLLSTLGLLLLFILSAEQGMVSKLPPPPSLSPKSSTQPHFLLRSWLLAVSSLDSPEELWKKMFLIELHPWSQILLVWR